MLGKIYTVRGFDKYGNVELVLKRLDVVWVEPEVLKLVAPKPREALRQVILRSLLTRSGTDLLFWSAVRCLNMLQMRVAEWRWVLQSVA